MENAGKLLILKHTFKDHSEKLLSLLFKGRRLMHVQVESGSDIGSIYVGKVKNVAAATGGCFVEVIPGQLCYLPLAEAEDSSCTLLLNRSWNGKICAGDEILVQVVKEAIKTKLPSVTTKISFSGKYVVISAGQKHLGISGKIRDDRKKEIIEYLQNENLIDDKKICVKNEFMGTSYGFVIRTNAGSLTDDSYLLKEWQELEEKWTNLLSLAGSRTCYSCLYKELPTYIKNLRDVYDDSYDEIITDQPGIYAKLQEYRDKNPLPGQANLRLYQDSSVSLENLYSVNSSLEIALGSHVWLKSGGYLVIEPTEALTVIDVNSGKYESKREGGAATAYKINMEAAHEIACQLKLRNLSGIIIVDFINMKKNENVMLMKQLKKLCSEDPVPTEVVDMTELGLVEITRKKINKSLREQIRG